MNEAFTWQENALYLVTVPLVLLLACFGLLGIVKAAKWWNER